MATVEEQFSGWLEAEDELTGRLRNLEWPGAQPALRQRCWEAIGQRLEEQAAEALSETDARFARDRGIDLDGRYDFSRRAALQRRSAIPRSFGHTYDRRPALAWS